MEQPFSAFIPSIFQQNPGIDPPDLLDTFDGGQSNNNAVGSTEDALISQRISNETSNSSSVNDFQDFFDPEIPEISGFQENHRQYAGDSLTGESPAVKPQNHEDSLSSYELGYSKGYSQGFNEGFKHGEKSSKAYLDHTMKEIENLKKDIDNMSNSNSPKYDFRGSTIGNVSDINNGTMSTQFINNQDDIIDLITSLREMAESFPQTHKEDVLDELEALETDINTSESINPERIGRRLKRLAAAGTAAITFASGAADFSESINEFTGHIQEIGENIGIEIGE